MSLTAVLLSSWLRAGIVGAALVGVVVAAPVAVAQTRGAISGVVLDPNDRPLPGVQIFIVVNKDVKATTTNDEGRFKIDGLPLGTHKVLVDLPGFALAARRTELTTASPTAILSFSLEIEVQPSSEIITIPPGPAPRPKIQPFGR